MGYSNYTRQSKDFTDKEWEAIVTDTKKMFAALPAETPAKGIPGRGGEVLQIDDQEGNPPVANYKEIFFNGSGYHNADHETFVLTKKKDQNGFSFCKTARKPYDLAVQACMLIAFHHAPGTVRISSDGEGEEWIAAVKLVSSLGINPFSIENCARFAAVKEGTLVKEIAVFILKEANHEVKGD